MVQSVAQRMNGHISIYFVERVDRWRMPIYISRSTISGWDT